MSMDLSFLSAVFGLSPEYKVVWVSDYRVHYYEPPVENYSFYRDTLFPYREHKELVSSEFRETGLYLSTHTVELEDGSKISANFAVSHSMKTIFLKVSSVGSFGSIKK